MTPSIQSQTFKSDTAFDVDASVREIVAQMPIVIFYNAVRDAFSRRSPAKAAPLTTRSFDAR